MFLGDALGKIDDVIQSFPFERNHIEVQLVCVSFKHISLIYDPRHQDIKERSPEKKSTRRRTIGR